MMRNGVRRDYLFGAIIVWLGIFVATALTVDGDEFATMLIILSGGAFWFIVIAPQLFSRTREDESRPRLPDRD